jgi:putative ubiquitin-RnfH superfamily antitoxin RatB of RatAB toxin-antitoxin module
MVESFTVEVAYATAAQQVVLSVTLPAGSTVENAIAACGVLRDFPELNANTLNVGIFSKPCSLQHSVQAGDRVEIYRPLHHDPKEARRQRARKN